MIVAFDIKTAGLYCINFQEFQLKYKYVQSVASHHQFTFITFLFIYVNVLKSIHNIHGDVELTEAYNIHPTV